MFYSLRGFCRHSGYSTGVETSGEGQLQKALRTLQLLDQKGLPVSRDIIYSLLQECIKHKNFAVGARVHTLIVCRGLDHTTCFSDHLIRLFAACGSLPEANNVFKNAASTTTYTWNGIISAHVDLGDHQGALCLYQKMLQDRGVSVDNVTLSCILKACSASGAILQSRVIHGHALEENLDQDVVVLNTLINTYSKNDSMEDAQAVFDGLMNRNVLSWGAIICGYSEQGNGVCALQLFENLQSDGLQPSRAIFLSVLKACNLVGSVVMGRKIHDQIIRLAFLSDSAIQSALVDMYAKCQSLEEAYAVFRQCGVKDVVTWGAMIRGCMENGQGQDAIEAFKKMQETRVKPNTPIFISLLKACSNNGELKQGMIVHEEVRKVDLDVDLAIQASLIGMYSNCGCIEKAQKVFDEVSTYDNVIWVAMIAAYLQHGQQACAVQLYGRMVAESTRLDAKNFVSMIKNCGNGAFCLLWLIHDDIVRGGNQLNVVLGSALVDMYGKCGLVKEARHVFDGLPERNVISWNAMLASYIQQGLELKALALFRTMLEHGIEPDRATLSCMVRACCGAGTVQKGREIHDLIIRNKDDFDVTLMSSIVYMYAQCGSLNEACKVFDSAAFKDAGLWGVVIATCCLHGNVGLASHYLNAMVEQGFRPNHAIFTSMLTACCHAGNLEEGHRLFKSMREDYGMMPDGEHYTCMIDLLSRTGGLSNARELFQSIPFGPDGTTGTSLLTGCKMYHNVDIGNQCFENAFL